MEIGKAALLAACRREPVPHTPVWFMRQAGRSLPEYRDLRGSESLLQTIARPEAAAELTLQPVRRYGVDAAILFSDIVVPLAAIGLPIDIVPGRGPVLAGPFGGEADLARIRPIVPEEDLAPVLATVEILREELGVPLIGFAGAPFTLASYLVEGGPSRTFARTKALMHAEPGVFAQLTARLSEIALATLRAEVLAGASVVQLFDSWAGALSPSDYERFALGGTRSIFEGLADLDVPRILFGVGTGELLGLMASSGADVVGVDWRVPLSEASRRVGGRLALQGNLDPALCTAPEKVALAAAEAVLADASDLPGHIFNLGHGVLPETDPGVLSAIVDLVHSRTARGPNP